MLTYMTANFSKFSGETFQVTYGTASAPYLAVRSLHHQCGQFPLTKWHSSHVEFVESYTNNDLNPITDGVTSALGVVGSEALVLTRSTKTFLYMMYDDALRAVQTSGPTTRNHVLATRGPFYQFGQKMRVRKEDTLHK